MKIARLMLALFFPLQVSAAEPYARASLEETGEIVTGQQVHVTVDVFVPSFFTSPPQFPLFELPNALVTLPEERTQNLNETANGIPYSGIRRRYAVVPQVAGDYPVPGIEIGFGYSVDGATAHGVAKTAPLSFAAEGEATGVATFVARNVTISQIFDRPPDRLKAGDAVVRSITVTAEDTQSIIIPPSDIGTVAGVGQNVKAPTIEDGIVIDRRTVSRRTETVVYTAIAEGQFAIPGVEYPWFDLDRHASAIARLPETTLVVAPAAATAGIAPEVAPERPISAFERRRELMLRIGIFLAMVALAWFLWRLAQAARRHLAEMRHRRMTSRSHRLSLLRQSIRRDEPQTVYNALQVWSRKEGFRTLHEWAARSEPLLTAIKEIEQTLYSGRKGLFDRNQLSRLVGSFRGNPKVSSHRALPPLNPVSTPGTD